MAHFIKPGFFEISKTGYKSWLNLDLLIAKISPPFIPKYKVYTALLNQTDSNELEATVLENTIGIGNWIRNSVGIYYITLPPSITKEKLFIYNSTIWQGPGTISFSISGGQTVIGNITLYGNYEFGVVDKIYLETENAASNENVEFSSVIQDFPIEIRIYN